MKPWFRDLFLLRNEGIAENYSNGGIRNKWTWYGNSKGHDSSVETVKNAGILDLMYQLWTHPTTSNFVNKYSSCYIMHTKKASLVLIVCEKFIQLFLRKTVGELKALLRRDQWISWITLLSKDCQSTFGWTITKNAEKLWRSLVSNKSFDMINMYGYSFMSTSNAAV